MEFKPFNDIWYLDCFSHGIAQIAYNYNFLPRLFENDYFEYLHLKDEGKPVVVVDTKHFLPWQVIFAKNGIQVNQIPSNYELMFEGIKKILNLGAQVMLPVDCFHEEIRKDFFNISHALHFLLIYGVDEYTNEFLLLEHDYENDLRYKHRRLSIDSAIISHIAAPNIMKTKNNYYYVFQKNKGLIVNNEHQEIQIQNGINAFLSSIHSLQTFVDDFCNMNIADNFDSMKDFVVFYKLMFEKTYVAKKYQSYFYNHLLQSQDNMLSGFANLGSFSEWTIIIGILYRSMCKNDFPVDIREKIVPFLYKIIDKECKWKEVIKNGQSIISKKN